MRMMPQRLGVPSQCLCMILSVQVMLMLAQAMKLVEATPKPCCKDPQCKWSMTPQGSFYLCRDLISTPAPSPPTSYIWSCVCLQTTKQYLLIQRRHFLSRNWSKNLWFGFDFFQSHRSVDEIQQVGKLVQIKLIMENVVEKGVLQVEFIFLQAWGLVPHSSEVLYIA